MLKKSIFIYLFLSLILYPFVGQASKVINAEIVLTDAYFAEPDILELDGRWRFYWQEFVSPEQEPVSEERPVFRDISKKWSDLPSLRNSFHAKGFASYVLNINSAQATDKLALRVPEFYSAYALYLNGELVSKNGKVGEDIVASEPYWQPKVSDINLKEGDNRLVIHISNFEHHKGGSVGPISLGETETLNFYRNMAVSGSLFIAGTLLISAVFSLIVYYFQKLDFAFLFFGLFALTYMYRIVGTDTYILHEVFGNLSWYLTIRLEYLSLFLSVIFFTYFYKNLIERRAPEWLFHAIGATSLIMALMVMLPPETFTAFIDYYLLFVAGAFIVTTTFYLRNIRLSHSMSWFTAIAVLSLIGVMVLKLSAFFGYGSGMLFISFFGYITFIISQTIALSQRFGYNMRLHITQSESAVVSQQNFMNSVSHELKTPMNAIMGMTEFLSRSKLDSDQQSKLETIRKNSEQLNNLLMDLLNFSAIDSGSLKLEIRKFDLREVVNKAVEQAEAKDSSSVNFKMDYDENIPEELAGDPDRFGQVVYHLLDNAFKFTEKGNVNFSMQMQSVEGNLVNLKMVIQDTGVGIKSEDLKKVTKAFSQANEGNTRSHGGTGLGLTISSNIIELMGGELWIDSEFGHGTTVVCEFVLKTPRLNLTKHAQELKDEYQDKIEGLKILYAEDNPINQKLLVMIMKTMGYEVDIANNGLEAWEMALTKRYQIIFMDVQMPKMDGIEATKRIVKDQPVRPIIIAVTANAEVADQKRCIEAGMNDFIPKPFSAKTLKEAIKKWQGLLLYLEEDSRDENLRVIS